MADQIEEDEDDRYERTIEDAAKAAVKAIELRTSEFDSMYLYEVTVVELFTGSEDNGVEKQRVTFSTMGQKEVLQKKIDRI